MFAWLVAWGAGSVGTVGDLSERTWVFLVLSGLSTGLSWICYFRALQIGDVNKVAPIDKSSTVLTMLLSFLLLGDPVTAIGIGGMILILAGTLLMIEPKPGAVPAQQNNRKALVWAVFSAVFASLTAILGKIGIEGVESNLGTAIRTLVVLVMAWGIVLVQGTQREIPKISKKSWLFLALSGVSTGLSWMFYYYALQKGSASVVAPIDKLSILVTVLFSGLVLHERLRRKAAAGLVLLTGGTLLLLLQ